MSQITENSFSGNEKDESLVVYREMLSALSDGELSLSEMQSLLTFLSQDSEDSLSLRHYWFRLQKGKAILNKDWEAASAINMELAEQLRVVLTLPVSSVLDSSVEASGNVLDLTEARESRDKKRNTLPVVQSVAVAASVMFVVLAGWFGTQADERQSLIALFSSGDSNTQQHFVAQDMGKAYRKSDLIEVSAGNIAGTNSSNGNLNENFHLDAQRIEHYMMLHAENASLNSNQGIIPFARVSHVGQAKEF